MSPETGIQIRFEPSLPPSSYASVHLHLTFRLASYVRPLWSGELGKIGKQRTSFRRVPRILQASGKHRPCQSAQLPPQERVKEKVADGAMDTARQFALHESPYVMQGGLADQACLVWFRFCASVRQGDGGHYGGCGGGYGGGCGGGYGGGCGGGYGGGCGGGCYGGCGGGCGGGFGGGCGGGCYGGCGMQVACLPICDLVNASVMQVGSLVTQLRVRAAAATAAAGARVAAEEEVHCMTNHPALRA